MYCVVHLGNSNYITDYKEAHHAQPSQSPNTSKETMIIMKAMLTTTKQGITIEITKMAHSPYTIFFRSNKGKLCKAKVQYHETTYEEYFVSKGIRWYINEFARMIQCYT